MLLDQDLKEQLHGVFQDLKSDIGLRVKSSDHPQQEELLIFLRDLASTSPRLRVDLGQETSPIPRFSLTLGQRETGIAFAGIPGGHEFTSLVLAILNSDGIGKMPDQALAKQIQKLPKGLKIRTYISLSCENCPEVVQALNQVALIHGQIQHEMIDGNLVTQELEQWKIQGVPSVMIGDKLIHSGRSNLMELLQKLSQVAGTSSESNETTDLGHFDVTVVGGGPAGVAAAIYSARKGLKTLLIAERIGGQVQDTKDIENLIGTIKTEGPHLGADLEKHMKSYPIQILEHRRVEQVSKTGQIELHLNTKEHLQSETLIVATGAKWRELGVPGEKQYIGRGVAFCPHCDGPYYKNKRVAVIGGGNSGVEAAIDLAGIAKEVTLFEYAPELKADKILVDKLYSLPNARVITNVKTEEVLGDGEKVVALKFEHRENGEKQSLELDGVFVQIGLSPNSAFIKNLIEVNRFGEIIIDEKGRTSMPGIYAAGDVTTIPYKQIVIAMGEGAKVALSAFEDRMRKQA